MTFLRPPSCCSTKEGAKLVDVVGDLGDVATPEALLPAVNCTLGHVDVLVCNHARGGHAVGLADLTARRMAARIVGFDGAAMLFGQATTSNGQ